MARQVVVGRGPEVPGTGVAIGTFLVLGLGVAMWWILDTLFPQLGIFVRGAPRVATTTGSIFDVFDFSGVA